MSDSPYSSELTSIDSSDSEYQAGGISASALSEDEYGPSHTDADMGDEEDEYASSTSRKKGKKTRTGAGAGGGVKGKPKSKSKTKTSTGKSAKSKKKADVGEGGSSSYRIRNALKVPRATTYTAQALYDQISSADIILDPEYQRDVVWPESKQIGIIDSVFRNFYIPPIIFAVKTHNDGSETKICIDGKQRLTSIHRFMDGRIPHKDAHTGEKLYFRHPTSTSTSISKHTTSSRKTIQLLPEKYKRLFSNKQIVCVEYQDITDKDEREVFQRVQLGMALTPAEKLQVISSPRAAFIRTLVTRHLKEDGPLGGSALEWDTTRGSDFRCVGQAIYYMDRFSGSSTSSTNTTGNNTSNANTNTTGNTSKTSNLKSSTKTSNTTLTSWTTPGAIPKAAGITQLEKWLNMEGAFSGRFKRGVRRAFRVFKSLVVGGWLRGGGGGGGGVKGTTTKVSPIEFQMMAVLIYVWLEMKGKGKGRDDDDMDVDSSSDEEESDDEESDDDGERRGKADDGVDKASLARVVQDMRDDVRRTHVDIRMNNRVGNHMLEFVKKVMDGRWVGDVGGVKGGGGENLKRKRSRGGGRKTMNSVSSVVFGEPVLLPSFTKKKTKGIPLPTPGAKTAAGASGSQTTAGTAGTTGASISAPPASASASTSGTGTGTGSGSSRLASLHAAKDVAQSLSSSSVVPATTTPTTTTTVLPAKPSNLSVTTSNLKTSGQTPRSAIVGNVSSSTPTTTTTTTTGMGMGMGARTTTAGGGNVQMSSPPIAPRSMVGLYESHTTANANANTHSNNTPNLNLNSNSNPNNTSMMSTSTSMTSLPSPIPSTASHRRTPSLAAST
ncbi:hypothetical protein CVT24_002602, partial [Panaeolus cyanescens]